MTIQIDLPVALKKYLEHQASAEGYESVRDYIQFLLKDHQRKKAKKELDEKLREGMKAPKIRMTEKRWEKLEKKILGWAKEMDDK